MSKIAGALNMLPKTILDEIITNDSTNEAIKIAKYSCISPRGGRGSSADIKGIFGFKYRRISSPLFFSFIEVVLRLKVLVPTDKFNLIDANTNFSITSENKNGGLTIEAYSRPSFDSFNFYQLDRSLLLRSCCHWLLFRLKLF
jgi:hypothetical protein